MLRKLGRLRTLYRTVGPRETGVVLGLTASAYALALKILQIVALTPDDLDPNFLQQDRTLRAGFATAAELVEATRRDPGLEMDAAFVEAAHGRGDRCYAIWRGCELASYGWYSNRPTPIGDGLWLSFDPSYTYMYKGFTKPAFRGRRLHGIGMARALVSLADDGSRGLVSYVERTNTASLKSVYRLGYRDVGRVITLSVFGGVVVRTGVKRPELAVGVQRGLA